MPKEVYELYVDLEEKWSLENLAQRFKERFTNHLSVNTVTRDTLLRQVDSLKAKYSPTTTVKDK